jgi:hypothetical protein
MAINLSFIDQSRYFLIQAAHQLSSQGWVHHIPDQRILRKFCSTAIKPGISGSVVRNFDPQNTEAIYGTYSGSIIFPKSSSQPRMQSAHDSHLYLNFFHSKFVKRMWTALEITWYFSNLHMYECLFCGNSLNQKPA